MEPLLRGIKRKNPNKFYKEKGYFLLCLSTWVGIQ